MEKDMTGHNSALSEGQQRALGFHHRGLYNAALAAKKKADADVKNAAKRALADGVSVDDIKLLNRLDTPEGEASLREELNRKITVAGWVGSEIGTQFSFDDIPDRSPLSERAHHAGKVAGYKGETCIAPHDGEAGQEWIRGWHEGQQELMSALELTRAGMEQEEAERAAQAAENGDDDPAPKKRGRPKGSGKKAKGKQEDMRVAAGEDPFPSEAAAAAH